MEGERVFNLLYIKSRYKVRIKKNKIYFSYIIYFVSEYFTKINYLNCKLNLYTEKKKYLECVCFIYLYLLLKHEVSCNKDRLVF